MDEARFLVEIRAAKNAIAEAEGDLAKLLQELRSAVRAEKVPINEGLQRAFDKLRAAREHLVKLEEAARERVE